MRFALWRGDWLLAATLVACATSARQRAREATPLLRSDWIATAPVQASASGSARALPSVTASAVEKERADVPEAEPVSAAGVRYQTPLFARAQGLPENGAYVEAIDEATGRRLWIVKVANARPDAGQEQDKRDVFITELKVARDGTYLSITDEHGDRYQLDLHTQRVTRLPTEHR